MLTFPKPRFVAWFSALFILMNFALFSFRGSWILLGIDGLGDMRPICGTIVAERKGKQGKEGKVRKTCFLVSFFI